MIGEDDGLYQVICPNCDGTIDDFDNEKEVVPKNDTRHIEDALRAENKRLREALSEICAIYEINGGKWRFDENLYNVACEALKGYEK